MGVAPAVFRREFATQGSGEFLAVQRRLGGVAAQYVNSFS